jgi:hypothetical protein
MRLFKLTMPILLAVWVNLLILGAHGTAMAATTSGHSSTGMSHTSSTSLSCISICTASAPQKLRVISIQPEKDDDNTPPFYVPDQQTIAQALDEKHSGETRLATALRPPPGPPNYVLNSVLRF